MFVDGHELIVKIASNIERVLMGKTSVIYDILKGIIADGHILIEDVPGVGKTTLVKAAARSLNLSFSRIQFTPDLLPSDITGISVYNQNTRQFEFMKGPVFANIVLADEINRTSPKTQSALLEVMEEGQVSEGNNTYRMEKPFIVMATQNPVEFEGTFSLPEAQLDRFIMSAKIGYAHKESESKIIEIFSREQPLNNIEPVTDKETLIHIQQDVKEVYASNEICSYVINIADATRNSRYISLGASTRGALCLLKIAKASAYIDGRDYVIPRDVKDNAVSVLSHRISISPSARAENLKSGTIIKDIVDKVPSPMVVHPSREVRHD